MKPEEILSALQLKGYTVVNNSAFFELNGYPHTITATKAGKNASVAIQFRVASLPEKQFKNELKRALPKGVVLGIAKAVSGQATLSLTLPAKDELFTNTLNQVIRDVTSSLRSAGIAAPSVCPVCRREGTDAYALLANAYVPAHRACVEETCRNSVASIEHRQANGNYLAGAAGALIGALIGAVPTFLTVVFLERISLWLCALIPLAAYGGYRLLYGKMTRFATVIILLCSLMQSFVLVQALFYYNNNDFMKQTKQELILYCDESGVEIGAEAALFAESTGIYLGGNRGDPTVIDFVKTYIGVFGNDELGLGWQLAQILIFVGLGVVACFGYISRTAAGEIKETMSVMETVRDKRGFSAPSAQESVPAEKDDDELSPDEQT